MDTPRRICRSHSNADWGEIMDIKIIEAMLYEIQHELLELRLKDNSIMGIPRYSMDVISKYDGLIQSINKSLDMIKGLKQ